MLSMDKPHMVRLHGGPAVTWDGRRTSQRAPTRRQASLALAYLGLHRLAAVPLDELADACWPDGPPATWAPSLRRVLSDLRAWLRASGTRAVVVSAQGACHLEMEGDLLDVEEAEVLLAAAPSLPPAERLDALRSSDALTREPLLPGLRAPFLDDARLAAGLRRQTILEARADAEVHIGDVDAAVAAAHEVVRLDPLRESAYRLAMAAHHRAGRTGKALRVYETCRATLAEELGVPPSTETVMLYRALLRADRPHPGGGVRPSSGYGSVGRHLRAIHEQEELVALESQLVEVDLHTVGVRNRLDVLIELGRAQWRMHGRAAAVLDVALAASEAAIAEGSADHTAAALDLLTAYTGVGRIDPEAERVCERARSAFPGSSLVEARVLTLQAEMRTGVDAVAAAEQAVAVARESGDDVAVLDALVALGRSLAWTPDVHRRLGVAAECERLLHSGVDPWRSRPTYEPHTRAQLGDVQWMVKEAERLSRVAAATGQWEPAFYARAYTASTALLSGDVESASVMAHETLALAGDDVDAVNAASGLIMAVTRERGDVDAILPSIADIAAADPAIGAFGAAHALARAVVGQHEMAAEIIRGLSGHALDAVDRDVVWLLCLGALAETLAVLALEAPELVRDTDIAPVISLLDPYAGQACTGAHGIVTLGTVDAFRGMLLASVGEFAAAERALSSAAALEKRMDAPLLEARTSAWLAHVLSRTAPVKNARRAARLRTRALTIARAPGRQGLEDMVTRILAPQSCLAERRTAPEDAGRAISAYDGTASRDQTV